MLRFRPSIVIAGTQPHAEDGWKRVRIGGIEFDVAKPCIRCLFTTVDFERGEFDPSGVLVTDPRLPTRAAWDGLATGAGSVIFSHVNDGGFWLIKEYFNMTVIQTFKTWTVLETLISLVAFGLTYGLSRIL